VLRSTPSTVFLFTGNIMNISIKHFNAIFCSAWLCFSPNITLAQDAQPASILPAAADLDLSLQYFNRELSTDGVLHESRYAETMLRRDGHVWTQRVLPKQVSANDTMHPNHEHKDFNYIVLPRHVTFDGNKLVVEFINPHDRQVIYIAPTEYENVNFDGSWLNTYYLINPQTVANMPRSRRTSPSARAQWHELSKNGLFQRVLWDEKLNIPLLIETGDNAGTFLQRIKISPHTKRVQDLPWQHLQGYTQKEYSDFLD
jgi:hypothetical protein